MIHKSSTLVPTLLFLAVLCLSCSGGDAAAPDAAVATPENAVASTDEKQAPDFALEDLEGNPVRLSDSDGQVRLVDFWATWCAPCRDEVPMLNELHEAYAEQGLLILAVSDVDEDASIVKPFVDEYDVRYPNLIGSQDVALDYKVFGLPTAYLIDREGRIVETFFGPKPRKQLEEQIRKLLEQTPEA